MDKYLIAYELRNSDRNSYTGLYEAIKGISGLWWHFLDSVWIVKGTTLTANEISERLRPHLNEATGDHILVIKIDASDKQGWLPKIAWNWLNDNGTPLTGAHGQG